MIPQFIQLGALVCYDVSTHQLLACPTFSGKKLRRNSQNIFRTAKKYFFLTSTLATFSRLERIWNAAGSVNYSGAERSWKQGFVQSQRTLTAPAGESKS
jgi:hypothetical protein